jgi:hypothetical protein
MVTAAERLTGGSNVYDSAGVLPTGDEYIGTIAMTADGTLRYYQGQSWDTLDSNTFVNYFFGTTSGYTTGGRVFSPVTDETNIIQKFSFATDANATDVGDLTVTRSLVAGQSSDTYGYTSGGDTPGPQVNTIDKFPFTSDANATDVGDLTQQRDTYAGQSSSTHGYATNGTINPGALGNSGIQKFPFSVDENATAVGTLTLGDNDAGAGQSSTTHGYQSGGEPSVQNIIQKFTFSTDANATDVGDLTVARKRASGQSSDVSGYTSGGGGSTNPLNYVVIDKFPFATDANATDVGDLTQKRRELAGQSSNVSGYATGGQYTTPSIEANSRDIIEKFSFTSDANATDVGDLTFVMDRLAGQQV